MTLSFRRYCFKLFGSKSMSHGDYDITDKVFPALALDRLELSQRDWIQRG